MGNNGSGAQSLARSAIVLTWIAATATVTPIATTHASDVATTTRQLDAQAAGLPCRWADDRIPDALELAESFLDPGRCPAVVSCNELAANTTSHYVRFAASERSARRDQRLHIIRPLRLGGADQDPDTPTGS